MTEVFYETIAQIQQLFAGRPVWLIILLALMVTVVLRLVLVKFFKFALNVLFFVLIFVLVLLGASYFLTSVTQ